MRSFIALWILTGISMGLGSVEQVGAVERPGRSTPTERPEIALHYDLYVVEGARVSDASGKKHDGTLSNGEIVYGRNRNAVSLKRDGSIAMADVPETFNPQSRSFTVGAYCQPAAADGVLVAMGDKSNGFSLYLKDSVPRFSVRSNGELAEVVGDQPVTIHQWVHLAGVIDSHGQLRLLVNAWPVAESSGKLLACKPAVPFRAGADLGSPVGDYSGPMHWQGLIQDVRLYWGVLDRDENRDLWAEWANRPACGCRK